MPEPAYIRAMPYTKIAEANAPVKRYLTVDSCDTRVIHFKSGVFEGPSLPVPCLAEKPQRMYREIENISSEMNAVIKFPDFAKNIMPTTAISISE